MKFLPAAIVLCSALVFTIPANLSGQTRGSQSRGGQHTQLAAPPAIHPDLNSALTALDSISQATQSDVTNLHIEKWKSGWKSGFLKKGQPIQQAQQASGSLQRNLENALPGLIHDVQASRGSISTTFKLYDDVSLVCEALDTLISTSQSTGHKSDAASLVDDYSALTRVRRTLATYIQQASSAYEGKGRMPYTSAAPSYQSTPQTSASSSPTVITTQEGVRKIVIDDTIPERKSSGKKNQ